MDDLNIPAIISHLVCGHIICDLMHDHIFSLTPLTFHLSLAPECITWALSPRRGLVLHSKIWVWNDPSLTFSFMKTGLSICEPDVDSRVVAPSAGPSPAAPEVLTITHEVDNLSNSLSFVTLLSSQVCRSLSWGNMPGKLRFSWYYQENDILIIPGNLSDLYSQDHEVKRSSPCASYWRT